MSVVPTQGVDKCTDEVMQQYGVLPWRIDRGGAMQVLLITSRRRGRWIVPRGWLAEGRPPYQSAALEAFEEAGVIGDILLNPTACYHYLKAGKDGSLRRCRVTLFSLQVRGTLTNWPERGQRKRRWFALREAARMVDDAELAQVIRELVPSRGC
ncbi:NUDIX hydrolase [Mesorhizobium sp. SB112]|uniref:NUDIX hydrolase n=1 Tax=Mesorhizobium sp. SB112 TaxID=3151853 RepID=UPI00326726FF